jgi:hypothetical protein
VINGRAACLFCAFLLVPAFVQGQGPPAGANLAARVAALEAAVAKLQGQITADDLAGEYRLVGFLADVDASNPPAIGVGVLYGTVRLLAGGTGSADLTLEGTNLVLSAPAQESPIFEQGNNDPLTWSYASGILTITTGSEVITFNVGAGGRVLTQAVIGDDGDKDLLILTRLR